MAYARGLLAVASDRLSFAAVHPTGLYGRLSRSAVLRFLDITEERWANRGFRSAWERRRFVLTALAKLRPVLRVEGRDRSPSIYLQASPNNLTKPYVMRSILHRERARFACLVHDLIPLEFPEYAKPGGADLHRKRLQTILDLADGVITNSQATLDAMSPWIASSPRSIPTRVAHLGLSLVRGEVTANAPRKPYFICIGTIEPRKNHLLLLHLWRQLAEKHGPETIPKLILVGRRGWENEQVVDMLERSPLLQSCIEEKTSLPDQDVHRLTIGARALLLPSFAEGFGMPVTEALLAQIPVICSDLPALREAGGDVPLYLDPLDGAAWRTAIANLALENSSIAREQAARRAAWHPPLWADHIANVLDFVHRIAA
jgi:glycosyltransferase involved in cell wall biosynthesis